MPITKSAKKALRRDVKRHQNNRIFKDRLKVAVDTSKANPTSENLNLSFSAIDRAAKKHLLHPNKAARLKSKLSRQLKSTPETKLETKVKAASKAKTTPKTKATTKSKTSSKTKSA